MHHFALVAVDYELLGVFSYERRDWLPGDVIEQGRASLRVVDAVPPKPRKGDGLEVGLLKVEPAGI